MLESEWRSHLLLINNKVIYDNNSFSFLSQEYLHFKETLLEKWILNLKKQISTDAISQTVWLYDRDLGEIFGKSGPENVIKEMEVLCIHEWVWN